MVVQLKRLEKALEQALGDAAAAPLESTVDAYLNENENIGSPASARLHEMLWRVWAGLPQRRAIQEALDVNLSPASTATSATVEVAAFPSGAGPGDPRALFLGALIRLAPCIINKDQLQDWWHAVAPLALDSTGLAIDVVERAQNFLVGVLTSSFYAYADPSMSEHFAEIAAMYGENVLSVFVWKEFSSKGSDKEGPGGTNAPKEVSGGSDERRRFVQLNCRLMFTHFARKDTKTAFTQINRWFVQPSFRIDMLDLVVEYLSVAQNSKLFRVYESPFWESLLTCLERDSSRLVLQLAITALSMLLVHVCDKLVPTGALFRVYGIFGRCCSWQASALDEDEAEEADTEEADTEEAAAEDTEEKVKDNEPSGVPEQEALASMAISHPTEWIPITSDCAAEIERRRALDPAAFTAEVSVKIIPLFTFLYGLFPINTLRFCRQCDEYFRKHNYTRRFGDYWSRFMVTRKAERIVRQFRVDPLLILGSEETELSGSVERFQEVGSVLGLTSVCTSRRIVEAEPIQTTVASHAVGREAGNQTGSSAGTAGTAGNSESTANDLSDLSDALSGDLTGALLSGNTEGEPPVRASSEPPSRTVSRAPSRAPSHAPSRIGSAAPSRVGSAAPSRVGSAAPSRTGSAAPSRTGTPPPLPLAPTSATSAAASTALETHLREHRGAFEMHATSSVGHWHRELLLIRTELAFANFSRDMSEQRALRWQKRAADREILASAREALGRENAVLRARAAALDAEVGKAVRSARNIMRERSAYETKILGRNREFRDKLREMEEQALDLKTQAAAAEAEKAAAEERADEARAEAARAEERARTSELTERSERSEQGERSEHGERSKDTTTGPTDPTASATTDDDPTSPTDDTDASTADAAVSTEDTLRYRLDRLEAEHSQTIAALRRDVEEAQAAYAQAKAEESQRLRAQRGDFAAAAATAGEERELRRQLRRENAELQRRCVALEHELRARKVHEEERLNELQAALLASRSYSQPDAPGHRFRGRGGAQGVPRKTPL